jgi:hypothetical protein
LRTHMPVLFTSAVLAALVSLMATGSVLGATTTLTATLKGGAAETPAGDPDGSGTATITIDQATRQVCWNITVVNIAPATASHIHTGATSVSGGVLVPLDVNGFTGSTTGCVINVTGANLQAIIANPADFYVNIHTADYPAGAIRGQLALVTPNTAFKSPGGSPLVPLGVALVLLGVGGALRLVRSRV